MARQTFRLNLSSSEFPFLSGQYGRSIVFPQQDMHYIRPNAFTGTEADKNIGIPQMIFCENVMPTANGYQSISYLFPIQGTIHVDFDQAFYLRDASENSTLFVPGVNGTSCQRYTYDQVANVWSASNKVVPSGAKCTVANLKSRTFVKSAFHTELWEWTGAWSNAAVPALVLANIQGVVAANSYLVAYDYNTIYWSSTLDPLDFLPSLVTGAGSQRILAAKGRIIVCYPIEDGFIVHTTKNAVIAKYSGNARFPWTFKEIKNSQGLANQEHATPEGDGLNQYVWTTSGLMTYGPIRGDQIFPALSEFLGERRIELYNAATKAIDVLDLVDSPVVKIDYIGARYLCISYGQALPMTHCVIFDAALKRWGKCRINHVDVFAFNGNAGTAGASTALTWAQLPGSWAQQNNTWFEYGAIISGGAASLNIPYRILGFLGADGSIKVASFDWSDTTDVAVMHIGRLQFLRNNLWTLHEIDAEVVNTEPQTKMAILTSLDGANPLPAVYPYRMPSIGKQQSWRAKVTGINHTLRFEGNFNLNSIVARGTIDGTR